MVRWLLPVSAAAFVLAWLGLAGAYHPMMRALGKLQGEECWGYATVPLKEPLWSWFLSDPRVWKSSLEKLLPFLVGWTTTLRSPVGNWNMAGSLSSYGTMLGTAIFTHPHFHERNVIFTSLVYLPSSHSRCLGTQQARGTCRHVSPRRDFSCRRLLIREERRDQNLIGGLNPLRRYIFLIENNK